VLLYAATSVSGEATAGTLKLVLVRPVGRVRFLLAKAVFLVALAFVLALIVSIAAWILGHELGGYGDIMEEGLGDALIPRLEAARIGTKPYVALALGLLPLLAYGALGLLISSLTTNSATAVTSAILVCLPLLYVLPVSLPSSEPYLFTQYATRYIDVTAEFAKGFDERWDFELLKPGLIVPPVYVLVLLGTALTIFRRKDVAL
jgi:ABC-2 type transport system permease protein